MNRRDLLQLASMTALMPPLFGAAEEEEPDPSARPIKDLLKGTEPVTWLFTGDSITQADELTMGWRSYPEHFAERVRHELGRGRDFVINTGIAGNKLDDILSDMDRRVLHFQPEIVSLMIGMNDCGHGPAGRAQFRQSLERFLDAVHQRGSLLMMHTPNAVMWTASAIDKGARQDLPAYVDVIRAFAKDHQLFLIDHYAHWLEARSKEDLVYWIGDAYIHPNQYGHVELANFIFRRLGIFDPVGSRTCRLFVP